MAEKKVKPKQVEKTLDELVYDLKENIVKTINESGLPVSITAMLMRELAAEVSELERVPTPKK